MRIDSSLMVDLHSERPSVIDQLRTELGMARVMEGRVVSNEGEGRYEALIGRLRLTLVPTRSLEVGSTFTARLEGGRLVLRFPEATAQGQTQTQEARQVTVQTVPQLLGELGLPAEPRQVALVQALLRAGVSITRQAVELFGEHVSPAMLQNPTLLSFAIQKGIAVNEDVLTRLESIMQQSRSLQGSLGDLMSALQEFITRSSIATQSQNLRDLLARMQQSLPGVEDASSLEQWLGAVRRGVSRQGLFMESRWMSEQGLMGGESAADLKQTLLELLASLGEGTENESEAIARLRRLTGETLAGIEKFQLASVRATWDRHQAWYLEIPLWIEQQPQPVRLLIQGEASQESGPVEGPMRVDLYTDLSEIGRIHGILLLNNGSVDGTLIAERTEIGELLNASVAGWLSQRQSEAGEGFPLKRMVAREARNPEEVQPPEVVSERTLPLELRRVNAVV